MRCPQWTHMAEHLGCLWQRQLWRGSLAGGGPSLNMTLTGQPFCEISLCHAACHVPGVCKHVAFALPWLFVGPSVLSICTEIAAVQYMSQVYLDDASKSLCSSTNGCLP